MTTYIAMFVVFVVMLVICRIESRRSFHAGIELGSRMGVRDGRAAERKVVHYPREVTRRLARRR